MMQAMVYGMSCRGIIIFHCLTLPAEKENKPISLWGQRHKHYLQEHKRTVYISLLTSGKLNNYLADIDEQATEMMFRLVEQMADKEGVTEQLKVENPNVVGWSNAMRYRQEHEKLYMPILSISKKCNI